MKRFFVNQQLGADFVLSGPEHNHLANVLRVKTGEHVIVCCGDKYDYIYEAIIMSKKATSMRFIRFETNTKNSIANMTVYMALIKPDEVALAIEKLNEIGVTEVVLFSSSRSNIHLKSVKIDRLNAIAEQSCKQCERSVPLKVRGVLSFHDLRGEFINRKQIYFCDETLTAQPLSEISPATDQSVCIVIGPEGGFTIEEHRSLCIMGNVKPVSLGKRILRAETAAIVGSTLLMSKLGEI